MWLLKNNRERTSALGHARHDAEQYYSPHHPGVVLELLHACMHRLERQVCDYGHDSELEHCRHCVR